MVLKADMKYRPYLKVGDIVKLSKRGKAYPRNFSKNSTLVVSDVDGNGADRMSIITCRVETYDNEFQYFRFYRTELWSTGANAFVKFNVAQI